MGINNYKFDKRNLCYIYGKSIDDDVNFAIKNDEGDKIYDVIVGQVFDLKFRDDEKYKKLLGEANKITPFIERDGQEFSVVNGLPLESIAVYPKDYKDIRIYILRKILQDYKKYDKFSLSELKYINAFYNRFVQLQAKHRQIFNERYARNEEKKRLKEERQKNKETLELQKEEDKKKEIMNELFGEKN